MWVSTSRGRQCGRQMPYRRRQANNHIPTELHDAHALVADIRDIGKREGPRYKELKDNDGVRLLIRLLYHGMQE